MISNDSLFGTCTLFLHKTGTFFQFQPSEGPSALLVSGNVAVICWLVLLLVASRGMVEAC